MKTKKYKASGKWTKPTEEMVTGIKIYGSGGLDKTITLKKPIPLSQLEGMRVVCGKSLTKKPKK